MKDPIQRTTIRAYDSRRGEWFDEPTFTAATGRELIAIARTLPCDMPSKLNPALTVAQVMEKAIAALADDAPVDRTTARNILSLAQHRKRADLDAFLGGAP